MYVTTLLFIMAILLITFLIAFITMLVTEDNTPRWWSAVEVLLGGVLVAWLLYWLAWVLG